MQLIARIGLAIILVGVLGGCAQLTTYNKAVDLQERSYLMDVKQRVVFRQARKSEDGQSADNVICAEPSPDALTVIGVSGGLSLSSAKADTSGNLGGALSENGAFIGLRTHSIQLLRDAMYRLCEGYSSGAVSKQVYQSMQRRYQSTMMGLIAIEQLTGPVVASQALLTTSAAASAGAGAGDAAVDKAQERVDVTSKELLTAKDRVDEADAKVATKQKASRDADKALADERAKSKPEEGVVSELKKQVELARDDLAAARRERDSAQRSLEVAEVAARGAARDLQVAKSAVSSSASGSGRLGNVAAAVAASHESLTRGVVDIVQEINTSYLRDSCFAFSSDLLRDPGLLEALQKLKTTDREFTVSPTEMVQSLVRNCSDILKYDAERLQKSAETRSKGSASTPK